MLSLALFILLSISLVALCLLRASTRDPMARLKELSSANYDLQQKVKMYEKFGFTDRGMANSTWGGEEWHEMSYTLF